MRCVARIVGQIARPVRWDLCLETMSDLGVTGILEMPPAGTLTGIAKRALPGCRHLRPEDPRPARRRPGVLRQARRGLGHRHHAHLADGRLAHQGHLPPLRGGRATPTVLEPGASLGDVASLRDRIDVTRPPRRPGRRVAGRGRRPGLARPAAGPAAPRGDRLMTTIATDRGTPYAAVLRDRQLPPVAGRPQLRDRRPDRLQRRVDPAALGHQAAPLRDARGDRAGDVGRRRPHGHRARRHLRGPDRLRDRRKRPGRPAAPVSRRGDRGRLAQRLTGGRCPRKRSTPMGGQQ